MQKETRTFLRSERLKRMMNRKKKPGKVETLNEALKMEV
jgi:hypothetical protein